MDLPLVPSSLHIFLVLPGVYAAALLSCFLPVFLSLMELGNSHAIQLHSSWCENEGEAKTLHVCGVGGGERQKVLPSLPPISLSPLGFGMEWKIDIPLPRSRPWRPFCPGILRGTGRSKGALGKQGSWSNPPLSFLPELIYKCLIHSVPTLVPLEPIPILSLGYRAGIFSGNSGNSHAHNPIPKDAQPHTLSPLGTVTSTI